MPAAPRGRLLHGTPGTRIARGHRGSRAAALAYRAFKSERQERRITCVMIETERREVDAAMTKIGKDRASLVCLKPRLKNPPHGGKAVEAALECVVYWPFCALLGAAAVIDYEVKRQPCPDERARAAKDAALAQRLEQLSERMKSLRKLAEEKGCAAPL